MATEMCEECGTRCAVGAPRCPHCSSKRLVPEETLAGLVPSLTVCCPNQECPAEGAPKRVGLAQVVPGVLVLPRLLCARCGYELLNVTEDIVPKITVHGGPSNDAAEPDSVPAENTSEEGGEPSSPDGGTSSTSSEKQPSTPETTESSSPPRARTTASRSKKARTGNSSAPSTDGGPADATSASND